MIGITRRVWALVGALGVAALAGCWDSNSSDDQAPMTVTVEVNGVASGELQAGNSLTIQVPSGAEVVMQSNVDSTWAPTDPDGTMAVDRSEPRYLSATLSSWTGATAVMEITNGTAAGEVITVTFQVDLAEFQPVTAQVGDAFYWQSVDDNGTGDVTIRNRRETVVDVAADGSWSQTVDSLANGGYYHDRTTYFDAEDSEVGFVIEGLTCSYEPPDAKVSFPLFVGKTWSNDTSFDGCQGDNYEWEQIETRTVQGHERISVPAGEFDTLRIHGEAQVTIYDMEERHATRSETCWWAVTLGRFVKCEWAWTYLDAPDTVYTTDSVLTDIER